MSPHVFFILSTAFCAVAVILTRMRPVLICYWMSSLFFGAGVLTIGSELLAAAVWFVSTLLTAIFALHGLGFGELAPIEQSRGWRESLQGVIPALVGLAFAVFVVVGFRGMVDPSAIGLIEPVNLRQFGELFEGRYLIATATFPLAFLIAWVGSAYLSRADRGEK